MADEDRLDSRTVRSMPAARMLAISVRRSSAVMWSGLRPVGMEDSETEVVSRVIYAEGTEADRDVHRQTVIRCVL